MMYSPHAYRLAADAVLLTHVLFVLFVVFGLVLVFIGRFVGWRFVRNPIFRILHLVAIGIVTMQAWLGIVCPLTTLENTFRSQAGDSTYGGTFVSHWVQRLLYYDAPEWVFVLCYSGFALLVVFSWYFVRPSPLNGNVCDT